MIDSETQTTGVVLLNLGGPESQADVEPFLYNLFADRKIIRLGPKFMQKPLARFIAYRRAPKSREAYQQIGGGSPLARITAEQGRALEALLNEKGVFKVVMAMRYWRPFAVETLTELRNSGINKLIALSLYPHYSVATTGSSLDDLKAAAVAFSPAFEIGAIASWPEQPGYIDCLAAGIREGLSKLPPENVRIVYSAHSLPVKFIEEGDPYLDHINKTIAALEKKTGVNGRLCFQSRSGPVKWLSPSTPEMLDRLAGEGCRNILMVPISFVSDHVETLYEIDILYRRMAEEKGMRLERSESLNTRPEFIRVLRDMVVAEAVQREWLPG